MAVSVGNITTIAPQLEGKIPKKINLLDAQVICESGETYGFDLEAHPLLVFLKAVGFQAVEFYTRDSQVLEMWTERLTQYQQAYIQDPQYLQDGNFAWDEISDERRKVIHCIQRAETIARQQNWRQTIPSIPSLNGPLGVDPQSVQRFLHEIESQTPSDTLRRVQIILQEYDAATLCKKEESHWSPLIMDIVSSALEANQLDRAVEISLSYQEALKNGWKDHERVQRLFSAYDPRGSEILIWSRIFESLKTQELVEFTATSLSTNAGPQILKMMGFRAQTQPDEMIQICLAEKQATQKMLLQWLMPHWKPKHFEEVWIAVKSSIGSLALFRMWLEAALHCSGARTFERLIEYFPRPNIFKRSQVDPLLQKTILDVLSDHHPIDASEFARQIKPVLTGKLSNLAEKIISNQGARARR